MRCAGFSQAGSACRRRGRLEPGGSGSRWHCWQHAPALDAPGPDADAPRGTPASDLCAICLGPLRGAETYTWPCATPLHVFHVACAVQWVDTQWGKPRCPLCRALCTGPGARDLLWRMPAAAPRLSVDWKLVIIDTRWTGPTPGVAAIDPTWMLAYCPAVTGALSWSTRVDTPGWPGLAAHEDAARALTYVQLHVPLEFRLQGVAPDVWAAPMTPVRSWVQTARVEVPRDQLPHWTIQADAVHMAATVRLKGWVDAPAELPREVVRPAQAVVHIEDMAAMDVVHTYLGPAITLNMLRDVLGMWQVDLGEVWLGQHRVHAGIADADTPSEADHVLLGVS